MTRPQPFLGDVVLIGGIERTVVRRAGTDARPILRVEGVSTREAVEALRGEPIVAEMALGDDEWWAEDLVGLRVVDGPTEVGEVARVISYPSCEVLEVGDLLVPLIDDAVRSVDLEAGVVDVNLEFLGAS
jgi:16S rRNA processing protein RimM